MRSSYRPLPRSLTVRLHETLKQCQDLKTEKSQMDRRINQLSEENGDLSFKVRVGVSGPHLVAQCDWVGLDNSLRQLRRMSSFLNWLLPGTG